MKLLLSIFLAAGCFGATDWYVDNAATGNNNGTLWTDAWEEFSDIDWRRVGAGDCVYISGGVTAKSYASTLDIRTAGTPDNPVTIRLGQEREHNGTIYLSNAVWFSSLSYSNITLDMSKDAAFSTNAINPFSPWGITNNIGMVICPSNAPSASGRRAGVRVASGLGIRLRWLEVHCGADTNPLNNGIFYRVPVYPDGERHRVNCEIGYCYIHHNTKDGIYDVSSSQTDGMGGLMIHHSIIMWNADDGFEGSNGVDFCYNRMGECHESFYDRTAHSDTIQAPGFNVRIYNNLLTTARNSATYSFPLADWGSLFGGNRFFYGNIIYRDNTNHSPGQLINFAPRNYNYGSESLMEWTNIVILNNTICASGRGVPGIKWGGFTVDVKKWRANSTYQTLSNAWILNNVLWRISQGFTHETALRALGPCDVDFNTIDGDGGRGSTRMSISTNTIHRGEGDTDYVMYKTPESYNMGQGTVSNMTATVTFVNTNPGSFDFRLESTDTGARDRGVDISACLYDFIVADMPDYDVDMLGNTRGADGHWDRGALEYVEDSGAHYINERSVSQ